MQFHVDDSCLHSLTIVTHKGIFQYTKVSEGVSPEPADVQRKMDESQTVRPAEARRI